MTAFITLGERTVTPELVLGYQTQRAAPTLTHTIIGRGDPDVTLKPVGLRTGTLDLFLLTEDDAARAQAVLSEVGVFTYTDDALPSTAMRFVVKGALGIRLDDQTRRRWVVSVQYAEVAA